MNVDCKRTLNWKIAYFSSSEGEEDCESNKGKQTYISRTSAEGSFETKGIRATSRNIRRYGASEKANSTPSFTIFIISDLCLFTAAPTNVPDSLEASSLQSERDLPISSWFPFKTLVMYRWYACLIGSGSSVLVSPVLIKYCMKSLK